MQQHATTAASTTEPVEDLLDEDPQIRGQNYVCLSFLNPEDVLVKKDAWLVQKFIAHLGRDIGTLLNNIEASFPDFSGNVRSIKERYAYLSDPVIMNEEYHHFYSANFRELEEEYLKNNDFQPTIRGLKIRGIYETQKEAQTRVATIKKFDRKFDVYIGQVGVWLPWSPPSLAVESQEYQESQLQQMMKKYKENCDLRDHFFTTRKEMMLNADSRQPEPQVFQRNLELEEEGREEGEGEGEVDPWLAAKARTTNSKNSN